MKLLHHEAILMQTLKVIWLVDTYVLDSQIANHCIALTELYRLQNREDCLRIMLKQKQSQKEQHVASLSCRRPTVLLFSAPFMCNRIQMKSSRRHLLLKYISDFFCIITSVTFVLVLRMYSFTLYDFCLDFTVAGKKKRVMS